MNFFKSSSSSAAKQKSPSDLVKAFIDNATKLGSLSTVNNNATGEPPLGGPEVKRLNEEITKTLRAMKALLSNTDHGNSNSDLHIDPATELSQLIFQHGMLKLLLQTMPRMDFEAKKDGSTLFGLLLRRQVGVRYPGVDYVCREKSIVGMTLRG
jgi:calcium binding protein 39